MQAAIDAGAAFVSIASRGSVGIADPATIGYLRRSVPPRSGVKASGGVKTVEQVRALLAAGADLIGTSAGISIVTGARCATGFALLVLSHDRFAALCTELLSIAGRVAVARSTALGLVHGSAPIVAASRSSPFTLPIV